VEIEQLDSCGHVIEFSAWALLPQGPKLYAILMLRKSIVSSPSGHLKCSLHDIIFLRCLPFSNKQKVPDDAGALYFGERKLYFQLTVR
jgi:hypothetical protein